jgi:putative Holliday junction resolvase
MGRILALDYGTRRIGVAVSDPTRTIASPLTTLARRAGKRPPWARLAAILEEREVEEVIIGLPLDLDGNEGDWADEVRRFGAEVERRFDLPVHWMDERLSSVRGEEAVRNIGLRKKERERKERVDAAAAAIILQDYLERNSNTSDQAGDGAS